MNSNNLSIPSLLTNGEIRFYKYDDEQCSLSKLDRLVRVRVDPRAQIVYWRYEDQLIFKQKEILKEKNYLYLDRIYDVRIGNPTNFILGSTEEGYKQNFMTIVSGSSITNLHFTHFVYLNNEKEILRKFANDLLQLSCQVRNEEHGLLYHIRKKLAPKMYAAFTPRCIEEDIIRIFDKNKKNTTKNEFSAIGKLLSIKSRQNVEIDDKKLIKIIIILTKFETSRLEGVFRKISNDEPIVNRLKFGDWIRKNQHDHRLNDARYSIMSDDIINSIFNKWEYQKDCSITSQMFFHWMASDECGVPITNQRMKLDLSTMKEPINRYFIDSSHNTYCSGNQLVYALGQCKAEVEMYRQALLSGCRCIELDVWDNKDKDDSPVITHGPTAVMGMNEISLIDVCEAIRECAFKTSPYPVILSIENHLGRKQQKKMVQIFRQIFGDLLLTNPLNKYPLNSENGIIYPTPEELKYKILIKAKKKFETIETRSPDNSSIDFSQQSIDLTEDEALEHQILKELSEEQRKAQLSKLPEKTTCSELSEIINYMQAFESNRLLSNEKNLELAQNENNHYIVSADENVVWNCLRNNSIEKLQNLTKSKIVRVYPKASRIYSTNYCPMIHWLTGAQMVALNIQTNCSNMQLNRAMFERNGKCGYVRKPDYLRFREIQLKPHISIPFTISYTVQVEVLASYFLSSIESEKYHRRSYVTIRLFDVPDEILKEVGTPNTSKCDVSTSNCRRTKFKEENNFVTNYERKIYSFNRVMLNDLSFIQFNVHNESGSIFAQRVLHIDTLNNGYRFITLRSPSNQCLGPASLLVRFDIFIYSDRTNLRDHKQMYNPHAFNQETNKWERRFSNPFAAVDDSGGNDFLLVEGTRKRSVENEPTTPTNVTKSHSFGQSIIGKIAFWKKK